MKLGHTAVAVLAFVSSTTLTGQAKPVAPHKAPGNPVKAVQQSDVASKSASFGSVGKSDALYKSALDAHTLEQAKKQVGKNGAFKGTVSKVFTGPKIVILDFDPQYRTALTAVVKSQDFARFPNLKTLTGKQVVVAGKFIDFHGSAEMVLSSPAQVKLVK